MSDLKRLWQLQKLEEQQEKSANWKSDPKTSRELKELKRDIEEGQIKLKDLKHQYEQVGQLQNNLSKEAQEIKGKLSVVSAKIYDGSLHTKEIETYQQRYDDLNKKLVQTEDRELEFMQQREDIKAQWDKQKNSLTKDTAAFRELHQVYLLDKEEIKERANTVAQEIQNLIDTIKQQILAEYRRLKLKHSNPISKITKDTCSGCHLSISFEQLRQLKRQEGLTYCSNCGRMLFWEPL